MIGSTGFNLCGFGFGSLNPGPNEIPKTKSAQVETCATKT
jgi:hypothetical protein